MCFVVTKHWTIFGEIRRKLFWLEGRQEWNGDRVELQRPIFTISSVVSLLTDQCLRKWALTSRVFINHHAAHFAHLNPHFWRELPSWGCLFKYHCGFTLHLISFSLLKTCNNIWKSKMFTFNHHKQYLN